MTRRACSSQHCRAPLAWIRWSGLVGSLLLFLHGPCRAQDRISPANLPALALVANGEFHAQHGVFLVEPDRLHVYSALPTVLNARTGQWEAVPDDDARRSLWKGEPYYYDLYRLREGRWVQEEKKFSQGPNLYLDFGPCDPLDQLDLPSTQIRAALPNGAKIKNITQFAGYATVVFSHPPQVRYPRNTLDAYSLSVALLLRDGRVWKFQQAIDVGADGFFCGTRTLSTKFANRGLGTVLLLYTDEPAASSNFRVIHSFVAASPARVKELVSGQTDASELPAVAGSKPAAASEERPPTLPKELTQAVADSESALNPNAVHVIPRIVAGAVLVDALGKTIPDTINYGLMQINSVNIGKTVTEDENGRPLTIGEDVETDWTANAQAGVALLALQYRLAEQEQGRKSTDESLALQAYSGYNGGTRNRHRSRRRN